MRGLTRAAPAAKGVCAGRGALEVRIALHGRTGEGERAGEGAGVYPGDGAREEAADWGWMYSRVRPPGAEGGS